MRFNPVLADHLKGFNTPGHVLDLTEKEIIAQGKLSPALEKLPYSVLRIGVSHGNDALCARYIAEY
jgi:hypothetical protein